MTDYHYCAYVFKYLSPPTVCFPPVCWNKLKKVHVQWQTTTTCSVEQGFAPKNLGEEETRLKTISRFHVSFFRHAIFFFCISSVKRPNVSFRLLLPSFYACTRFLLSWRKKNGKHSKRSFWVKVNIFPSTPLYLYMSLSNFSARSRCSSQPRCSHHTNQTILLYISLIFAIE
jgi:hypothetical protein